MIVLRLSLNNKNSNIRKKDKTSNSERLHKNIALSQINAISSVGTAKNIDHVYDLQENFKIEFDKIGSYISS